MEDGVRGKRLKVRGKGQRGHSYKTTHKTIFRAIHSTGTAAVLFQERLLMVSNHDQLNTNTDLPTMKFLRIVLNS